MILSEGQHPEDVEMLVVCRVKKRYNALLDFEANMIHSYRTYF